MRAEEEIVVILHESKEHYALFSHFQHCRSRDVLLNSNLHVPARVVLSSHRSLTCGSCVLYYGQKHELALKWQVRNTVRCLQRVGALSSAHFFRQPRPLTPRDLDVQE